MCEEGKEKKKKREARRSLLKHPAESFFPGNPRTTGELPLRTRSQLPRSHRKRKNLRCLGVPAEPEIGRIASRSPSPRPRHGGLEAMRSASPALLVAEANRPKKCHGAQSHARNGRRSAATSRKARVCAPPERSQEAKLKRYGCAPDPAPEDVADWKCENTHMHDA